MKSLVIVFKPGPRVVSKSLFFRLAELEGAVERFGQRFRVDMEISAEVAGFLVVKGHANPRGRADNFVHGRGVRRHDQSATAHRFDDIVPPALGARGAEVDAVLVQLLDQVLLGEVSGEELHIVRHGGGRVFAALDEREFRPVRVGPPEIEQCFGAFERAATREVETAVEVYLDLGQRTIRRAEADMLRLRVL